MENPEEVLQALDEFQKMRPTEIPRELEDYLGWVAKTGDPVYQWSLIKSLFREKLTRVMTDFYESCPTLELAPCPNVEHFNYDTMKSNLLERLESFANAPFTVQRICELLTAPRKEYNRIDKFMRAIEKNILVVSTREPGGPAARRNENGESMVNGALDEDNPLSSQPSPDIEMEAWVKDYTLSGGGINVHGGEPADVADSAKSPPPTNHGTTASPAADKQSAAKNNPKNSNFVPSTSQFPNVNDANAAQSQDSADISASVQNLSQISSMETSSTIAGDVPEAIMNEDTSSQPSLDLENEDEGSGDSAKKLQTTFQAKDFEAKAREPVEADVRCYSKEKEDEEEEVEEEQETSSSPSGNIGAGGDVESATSKEAEEIERSLESKSSEYSKDTDVAPIVECPLEATSECSEGKEESLESTECFVSETELEVARTSDASDETIENSGTGSIENTDETRDATSIDSYKSDENSRESNNDFAFNDESLQKPRGGVVVESSNSSDDSNGQTRAEAEPVVVEAPLASSASTIEESRESSESEPPKDGSTIEETVEEGEDITRLKPLVPSPIPIIEEPKDSDSSKEDPNVEEGPESVQVEDVTEDCKESSESRLEESIEEEAPKKEEIDDKVAEMETKEDDRSKNAMESTENVEEAKASESMEVDGEEARVAAFSQDEPMEQEMTELTKS